MVRFGKVMNIVLFYVLIISLFLLGTALGNKTVEVIAQTAPVERKHCIVIDAGHGGADGGAPSCTGKPESGVNLEIALRLEDLLHLLGYKTVMIRKTDTSVYTKGDTIAQQKVSDLRERVRIVNTARNGILVSIHQNHFAEERYSGAQVFYAATQGSRELAEAMQTAFVSALNPGSHRKAKQSKGVYLMEKITVPGVLVECGFLSNQTEAAMLETPEYQKKICCVIASTLTQYLGNA